MHRIYEIILEYEVRERERERVIQKKEMRSEREKEIES